MQFLATVGNAFLHLSGTTPLPKCRTTHRPFSTFYQTGCDLFDRDIRYPFLSFMVGRTTFFREITEKESSKETNIDDHFYLDYQLWMLQTENRFFLRVNTILNFSTYKILQSSFLNIQIL